MNRTTLVYDAECSLCRGCMNWIKSHAISKEAFEFIACQSKELKNRFPEISEDACLKSLHAVTPDGRILTGDKSLPEILCRLRYFRMLTLLFKIPLISLPAYLLYHWLADNRYIISRTVLPLTEKKV